MSDENSTDVKRTYDVKNLPKTFMSPAYVLEKEPGVFAMYRDILIEENGKREKFGKPIGPMFLLREAKGEEAIDFITSKPDGTVIQLHRFHPPRLEEELIKLYSKKNEEK